MKPSARRWKMIIGAIFLASFLGHIVQATLVAVWGVANPESRTGLFTQILTLYSPHFGTILGGILVAQQGSKKRSAPLQAWQFWTVLLLSLTWNLLLLGRYALLTFDLLPDDTFAALAAFQTALAGTSGVPVAVGLAFLYGTSTSDASSP